MYSNELRVFFGEAGDLWRLFAKKKLFLKSRRAQRNINLLFMKESFTQHHFSTKNGKLLVVHLHDSGDLGDDFFLNVPLVSLLSMKEICVFTRCFQMQIYSDIIPTVFETTQTLFTEI